MTFIKKHRGNMLFILLEILIGILLLIDPVGFTTAIITGAGIMLLVRGVVYIYQYIRAALPTAAKEQLLTKGLLALLAGGFCAARADWFMLTFPALTILYGIAMLVAGIGKVQLSIDMLRMKVRYWFLCAISAAVSILCAIIVIRSPFATTTVLWMFTGITLIVEAVLDGCSLIFGQLRSAR